MPPRTPSTSTLSALVGQLSSSNTAIATATTQQSLLPQLITDVPAPPAMKHMFTSSPNNNNNHLLNLDLISQTLNQDQALVTLEHTSSSSFELINNVPLVEFLSFLNNPPKQTLQPISSNPNQQKQQEQEEIQSNLYLAQIEPPKPLKQWFQLGNDDDNSIETDVSIEWLKQHTTKTSIWLGLTPTTTPWHRDPDFNLLFQLKGTKKVRLMEPKTGQRWFEKVVETQQQQQTRGTKIIPSSPSSSRQGKIRGQEMMLPGPLGQRDLFENLIWQTLSTNESLLKDMWQIEIQPGQALFIPLGWWHAVRGRTNRIDQQQELTASVNWWFRP
ncbi:hypothetical protein OIO90_004770 [Microbotryomycetes sp. JL221]|nr:hypothetical protein OIO90_004770 [Microbotryomycetes sp. JL221]